MSTIDSGALTSLHRYRPAVYVLTALAAGLAIYCVNESRRPYVSSNEQSVGLHRSNAVRRRRRSSRLQVESNQEALLVPLPSLDFLSNQAETQRVHAWYRFTNNGEEQYITLNLLTVAGLAQDSSLTRDIQRRVEEVFLMFYFHNHLQGFQLSQEQRESIIESLQGHGISQANVFDALHLHLSGRLRSCIDTWIRGEIVAGQQIHDLVADRRIREEWIDTHRDWTYSVTEAESVIGDLVEESRREDLEGEGGSLLKLLWRIAEDQNRREGFVHRGITCNGCNACPIKGIRYRCSNCLDYDLCEACEAQQFHDNTHLFYKVRIPRSHLGHQPQHVKYPGGNLSPRRSLGESRIDEFVKRTGYSKGEIEGLWEQFKCTATASWADDPLQFHLAIDRRGFEQLFVSTDSTRPPAPNIVYDRIFSMYDTDNNELIGFEELALGLSKLNKKGPKERWRRVFAALDIDADGYVNRKDCLRMFRGHYALTKAMTAEIIAYADDEGPDDDTQQLVAGAQPLSSAFVEPISAGLNMRAEHNKAPDSYGDNVPLDSGDVVDSQNEDPVTVEEIVAQRAEEKVFGTLTHGAADLASRPIRDIIHSIYHDPWPPSYVAENHVKAVVSDDTISTNHEVSDPNSVTDPATQLYIRRMCHQAWAIEWQHRQFYRWQAIKDRRRRQVFLHDTSIPAEVAESSANQASAAFPFKISVQERENFSSELQEMIAGTHRCFPNTQTFCASLLSMVENGWNQAEIAQSLKGFTPNDDDIGAFVAELLSLADRLIPGLISSAEQSDSARSTHRSRSSSKVRFEDGLTTEDDDHDLRSVTSISSKSVSFNERWGGLGMPEPEDDVGRETMYQVLREAFNEVLDPIFRTREDLWLDAQATKSERRKYRSAICNAVELPRDLLDILQSFLKQCHIKADYPMYYEGWRDAGQSDATIFADFLKSFLKGVLNELTSDACPKCENGGIAIGRYCPQCGSGSFVRQRCSKNKSLRTEKCVVCAKEGRMTRVQEDDYCRRCHSPSVGRAQNEEWLWTVLAGDVEIGKSQLAKKRLERLQPLYRSVKDDLKEKFLYGLAPIDREALVNAAGASNEPSDLNSPELSIGETSIGGGSSNIPLTPSSDDVEPALNIGADDQATKAMLPELPQVALELHDAVRSSASPNHATRDETDPKTLEQLLYESGHTVTNQTTPKIERKQDEYRDPTLPQHRPNTVEEADAMTSEGKTETDSKQAPDADKLQYLAVLTILEAHDAERGGPGRISEEEFLDIMLNERGKSLEFIGEFMDLTAF